MNLKMLIRLLSVILLVEAGLMIFPMITCLIYGESPVSFLLTMGILIVLGIPGICIRPDNTRIYAKDGFVCVAASWILMSAFGALPFVFSGSIPNYIDAFFETVSGFTTTGATVLSEVESLGRGILFWRSFTHWVGGMGVLVFVLAVIPTDNSRSMNLMKAEVPGPTKGKLVPKMRQTARILYGIYIFLTALQTVLLCCTGMPFYDSLVNSFAVAGTGGFSVLNNSIAGYNNPAAEWVMTVFMVLCGINFNMYYFILIRRFSEVFKSEELRTYLLVYLGSVAVIALNILKVTATTGKAIRDAAFQAASIISTTGFSTLDYDTLWPSLAKGVLILLTITGACAGSTAGGLKMSRVLIIIKSSLREIKQVVKPKSVNTVRLDGEAVPESTARGAVNYFALYMMIIVFTTLALSVDGFNFETNLTATLTCINNVGPGFGAVGPAGNFGGFSFLSKILLSLNMLLGRLEIMPLLILFSPSTFRSIRRR